MKRQKGPCREKATRRTLPKGSKAMRRCLSSVIAAGRLPTASRVCTSFSSLAFSSACLLQERMYVNG